MTLTPEHRPNLPQKSSVKSSRSILVRARVFARAPHRAARRRRIDPPARPRDATHLRGFLVRVAAFVPVACSIKHGEIYIHQHNS